MVKVRCISSTLCGGGIGKIGLMDLADDRRVTKVSSFRNDVEQLITKYYGGNNG